MNIVIIGASMAGLSAAAALAPHAERITVLERDPKPERDDVRRGTPQAHQIHLLLGAGQQALERLLPGILDELRAEDLHEVDRGRVRWFHAGVWKKQHQNGGSFLPITRRRIEHVVRQRVLALDSVNVRWGCPVDAPVFREGRVVGLRLRDGKVLDADLVVDASGRGTPAPRWFRSWGLRAPREWTVEVGLGYVTREVKLADPSRVPAILAVYPKPPEQYRAALLMKAEDGRCVVTMMGYHGDHAPTDRSGFDAYAASLAQPDIAEALEGATDLRVPVKHTYPRQLRRRWEQIRSWPEGFLPLGDAFCSLDPCFGQGMSVAALEAVALGEMIEAGSFRARDAVRRFARIVDVPWQMTTTEAWRWPEARGYRPRGVALMHWLEDRLFERSEYDEVLYGAFIDVMHLERPLTRLLSPSVLWRLFRPRPRAELPATDRTPLPSTVATVPPDNRPRCPT